METTDQFYTCKTL